jgi:hypothetical protein
VKHYEERPEIEQDYEQMKSGGWKLQQLCTTRYSEIVFYFLSVLLSYSLYHIFTNTRAGSRFANKTRQAIALEQLCTQRTHVIVYAGGYFEIFETLTFVHLVLGLSPPVQERLRQWLDERLKHIEKQQFFTTILIVTMPPQRLRSTSISRAVYSSRCISRSCTTAWRHPPVCHLSVIVTSRALLSLYLSFYVWYMDRPV